MSSTNRGAARDTLDRYYTPQNLALACVRAMDRDTPLHARQHRWAWEPHVGGGSFRKALQLAGFAGCFVSDKDVEAEGLYNGVDHSTRSWSVPREGQPAFHVRSFGPHDFLGERQKYRDDFRARGDNPQDIADRWSNMGTIVGNPPYEGAQDHVASAIDFLQARHFGMSLPDTDRAAALWNSSRTWRVGFLLPLGFLASERRRHFFERYPLSELWLTPKRPDFTGRGGDSADYAFFVWERTSMERRRALLAEQARSNETPISDLSGAVMHVLPPWTYTEEEMARKKALSKQTRKRPKGVGTPLSAG